MPPQSFQTLPWDIAHSVVCYIADKQYFHRTGTFLSEFKMKYITLPLLSTSQLWRSAALSFVFHTYTIVFPQDNGFMSAKFKHWPMYKNKPEEYVFGHVRTLNLEMKANGIASGCALQALQSAPVSKYKLANLNTLILHIQSNVPKDNKVLEDHDKQIQLFGDWLTTNFKSVKNVNVVYNNPHNHRFPDDDSNMVAMLYRLLSISTTAKLGTHHPFILPLSCFQPIPSLTSLDVVWDDGHERLVQLFKCYASQLIDLSIVYHRYDGIEKLVHSGGLPISYPALEQLSLLPRAYTKPWRPYYNARQPPALRISTEGMPFPYLRRLQVAINYPFSDDTLFRGNSKTLEELQIMPNDDVFNMLRLSGTFEKGKYTHLHSISMTPPIISSQSEVRQAFDLPSKFIMLFSSTLKRYAFGIFDDHVLHIPEFEDKRILPLGIQVLDFGCTRFSIADIIALLKHLPHLHSLRSNYKLTDGKEIKANAVDELMSIHYPANKNFWKWSKYGKYDDIGDFAECAILLAILCPNFCRYECEEYSLANYSSVVARRLNSQTFNKYASQIKHILCRTQFAEAAVDVSESEHDFDSDNNSDDNSGNNSEPEWSLFA